MKYTQLFEDFINEGKSFEFSFNYNTDEDDVKYIQGILRIAGANATAEPGIDSEEMVIKAKNAVELNKAKKAIQADGFEVNESVINEAKGYSFTIKYSDAKHVQQVLDDAGVDALAKAGVDDEEVIVRAFDGMGLRKAKQVIHAEVTTEFKVNEGINVKDIKVGTILTFKDGETWKVTKTSGISSGKIFAAPYGETKKSYVSLPLEFSIAKLEKDVTSIE